MSTDCLANQTDLSHRYGQYCVKWYVRYKDYSAHLVSDVPYFVRERRCYVCLHPDAKYYLFDVCRSDDYAPGQQNTQFLTEEEGFIENYRFTGLER